mgnify:CR=1 FL=1
MKKQKVNKEEFVEEVCLALKDVFVGEIEKDSEGVRIRLVGGQGFVLKVCEL